MERLLAWIAIRLPTADFAGWAKLLTVAVVFWHPAVDVSAQQSGQAEKPKGAPSGGHKPSLLPKVLPQRDPRRPDVSYDNREPVKGNLALTPPFSAVCQILTSYGSGRADTLGTGFLIDAGIVVTAAHVLSNPRFGPGQRFTVTPGCGASRTGIVDLSLAQVADRSRVRIHESWGAPDHRADVDYGVIMLPDRDRFRSCGRFFLQAVDDKVLSDHVAKATGQFLVAGFPDDKPFGSFWFAKGSVLSFERGYIRHLIPTLDGQSGGPLGGMGIDKSTGKQIPVAFGVHSRGGAQSLYNVAARVDAEFLARIETWKREFAILDSR